MVTPRERTLDTVPPNVLVIRGEVDLARYDEVSKLLHEQLHGLGHREVRVLLV